MVSTPTGKWDMVLVVALTVLSVKLCELLPLRSALRGSLRPFQGGSKVNLSFLDTIQSYSPRSVQSPFANSFFLEESGCTCLIG